MADPGAAPGREKLVRDVMQHGVPTVRENTPLPEVAKVFHTNDARIVVVVDEFDEASGVITEMDLLEHYRNEPSRSLTAEDIMQERVFTASPVAKLSDIASLLLERNVEHLVVVHGQGAAKLGQAMRPVAVVSARHIVHVMADELGA